MTLSYRLLPPQIQTDQQFARLLALLKKHRRAVDEISLFTEYWHHLYQPLEQFAAMAAKLGRRIEQFRQENFKSVGINMLCTIGHVNEAWDYLEPLPFQAMVGHDGGLSRSCACPNTEAFRQYTRARYTMIAQARPDFIWIDDDLRMHDHGVAFGCFCPVCLELFAKRSGRGEFAGRPPARNTLVRMLEQPKNMALRRKWVRHKQAVLCDLLRDVAKTIRRVDKGIKVGYMTCSPMWTAFSGHDIAAQVKSAGASKLRPGGGFWNDAQPRDLIDKALKVAHQCVLANSAAPDVQYEVENFPFHKLDKSVQIVLSECAMSLACGCNGVAFDTIKDLPGSLDDYQPLLAAIAKNRPMWDAFIKSAQGLHPAGFCPAWSLETAAFIGSGKSWFCDRGEYDCSPALTLAHLGLPISMDLNNSCGTILTNRLAETFTTAQLRRICAGGVMMDASSLAILASRGLASLAGVAIGKSYDNGLIERFTNHPLNGPFAGDGRDARLSFGQPSVQQLIPAATGVHDLAHMIGYDGSDKGCCLAAYENQLGGRVVTMTYIPWARLANSQKRSQLLALADWISRSQLPVVIDKTLRVTPLVRASRDGKRLACVLLNASFDATGRFDARFRTKAGKLFLLTLKGAKALTCRRTATELVVTIPSIPPWQTAMIVS